MNENSGKSTPSRETQKGRKMRLIATICCAFLIACEGQEGPVGPQGPPGPQGPAWSVEEVTGTILNRNYTEDNPDFASIHIVSSSLEPTVLYFAWENDNGAYINTSFIAVVWADADDDERAVSGMGGWYVLIYDPDKDLVGKNYKLRFVL